MISVAAVDSFEEVRRRRETANEIVINQARTAIVAVAFAFHIATRFLDLPFVSPGPVLAMIGIVFFGSIVFHFHLRSGPPYRPSRKYFLTALEAAVVTTVASQMRSQLTPTQAALFPLSIFLVVLHLASLRYSTRAVVQAGLQAIVLHHVFFARHAPADGFLQASIGGAVLLAMGTFLAAYNVSSLLRLHRESVFKDQLSRFLSPELVEEIARRPALLEGRTESRRATVLFTDIRGFTSLSEGMSAGEVVAFLNVYLEEMTAAILAHRGMLDKYIGDAVMGVYGVPFEADDHAARAVRTGLEMVRRLDGLNRRLTAEGRHPLSIGVGIHTGDLVVGSIGSSRRLEYTVIGDAVNVAARIESLTRSYDRDVLVSEETRREVGDAIAFDEVDTVQVKGRKNPITILAPRPEPV